MTASFSPGEAPSTSRFRWFLSGGGLAGDALRAIDWARTSLGPVETWPSSLRTMVGMLLRSPQPMFLWWGPELIQFYNDAYLPNFHFGEHPAAMGRRARDTWPEEWAIIAPTIDDMMSSGTPSWNEDVRVPILRNGTLEETYWTYGHSPVFDEAGGIGGVLVICTETTERVVTARRAQASRAEADLARSRIVSFLKQAPAGICVLRGPTLVFELANEQYERLVGRTNLVGRAFLEALPELNGQGLDDRMREVMKTGEPFVGREALVSIDRDGKGLQECYFTFIWSPVREANGDVDRLSVFAFDVTAQVTARRSVEDLAVQLERAVVSEHTARQAAEVANRAKDEFLATVSHELRTPLTAMLGWARMLAAGKVPPARYEHALRVIERNALAQARLIDDLLDVSRIISGNMRLHRSPVDLVKLVESAIDSIKPVIDAKSIELRSTLGPVTSAIMGDPNRLQQVIWNLLVNAAKFTHKGGHIHVTLECADSWVELRVDDDGQGISADFLAQVFDRFKQAEQSVGRAHHQGGLGLGLAISRHLVELHGGRLLARSEGVGRGASFSLELPLAAPAELAASRPGLEGGATFEHAKALEGLRVLVVDDEADTRAFLMTILADCGAIPLEASSAVEALDVLAKHRPDVLISDIGMPGEDGYSLIRRARLLPLESGAGIPAAALTAYTSDEDRSQALVAGYQMYLPKPVDPAELVAVVAGLARIARSIK